MASHSPWTRILRCIPESNPHEIVLGQPVRDDLDVGAAIRDGQVVKIRVFEGLSALSAGKLTDREENVGVLLSPLTLEEVGTIRCVGLNYVQHAKEVNMTIPTVPTLFLKPAASLASPSPAAPTIIPKFTLPDDCCDYESELVIVIGKEAKNITEDKAYEYILGYTAANDISSRVSQLNQSQWCFSKGFDGSCPIGPVIASTSLIPDPSRLHVRGVKNGEVVQNCGTDDLIFSIAKIVSFCSQGTTLNPGTIILTGTPAGVGHTTAPEGYLRDGDRFEVEILPYIGTLTSRFVAEK